jgi:hypothetical protein
VSQSDFVTRGQALVAAGQFQEAVKVCRLGLLGRPTTVEGRVVLGQALLALKRFDEVLAEMRVALELDHTSVPAQVLKGEALLRKGDGDAAIDILARARQQAPGDPRISQLLAEAERATGRPAASAGHPAMNFFSGPEVPTKHYPNHPGEEESGPSGSYTRPTSLAAPSSKKKSSQRHAAQPEGTPSPAVLAVGDRSGTVEVDPDAERRGRRGRARCTRGTPDVVGTPGDGRPARIGEAIARVSRDQFARTSSRSAVASRRPRRRREVSSVELIADDLERSLTTTTISTRRRAGRSRARTRARGAKRRAGRAGTARGSAGRSTVIGQPVAQPLARMLASQPQVIHHAGSPIPPTPSPLPPPPHRRVTTPSRGRTARAVVHCQRRFRRVRRVRTARRRLRSPRRCRR